MSDTQVELDLTAKLGQAFDILVEKKYGHLIAPEPMVTPFGVAHMDALLGGGIVSSGPVMLSSTPETGKSTAAFQLAKSFQTQYPNSVQVYIDIEGSGNSKSNQYRISRIESFGLDPQYFKYNPAVLDVMSLFELIEQMSDLKKEFEERTGKEFHVLIIWDSIASTPSSKTADAEDHNKIIGLKARQLSFCLEKYGPTLKFKKITFVCIDQVRANISMEGPYAQKERSVGTFKDLKGASNIYALQHSVQQWIFLSKKKLITPADGMGINGWYMDVLTEKNKLAPGQHTVRVVFDKQSGIDKFWSEYTFLSEQTPSEEKIYKKKLTGMPMTLCIKKSGAYVCLSVKDPENPEIQYKSSNFYKKDAKQKYLEDEEFRNWFDYAVQLSVQHRIINGMFLYKMEDINSAENTGPSETEQLVDQSLESAIDPETGEVLEYNEPQEQSQAQEYSQTPEQIPDESVGGYQSVFDEE